MNPSGSPFRVKIDEKKRKSFSFSHTAYASQRYSELLFGERFDAMI